MSIASLCSGDEVTVYSISESGWSDSAAKTAGKRLECRIDTSSSGTDVSGGRNDESSRHIGFFSREPNLSIGHYCKWTKSGGIKIAVPRWLKVTGYYTEGRPGKTMLWIVEFENASADGVAGL